MIESPPPAGTPSLRDFARTFFEMARQMFLQDGTHVPLALLFKQGELLGPLPLKFTNQAEKDASSRALATTVAKVGADALIVVNEVWVGKLPSDGVLVAPSQQPDRQEALALIAENAQGESLYMAAPIHRSAGGKPTLGEVTVSQGQTDGYFGPVREKWHGMTS